MSERLNNKEDYSDVKMKEDIAFHTKNIAILGFYYIYCRKIVNNSDFST